MRFNFWQYCHFIYYKLGNISNKAKKTNTLLNLINEQNDIDKIYLYARDLNELKYGILIKRRKDA